MKYLALSCACCSFAGSGTRLQQPIGEENRGFRLLTKMGWKRGQGLGVKGDGIKVPVVLGTQVATLGLGKSAEDDR